MEGVTDPTREPARPPTAAPATVRLLSTPVTVLWFLALIVWASGRTLDILGLPLGLPLGVPVDATTPGISATSLAVLLGATGLGLLYRRRGFDALTRVPAVTAIVMSLASALAAVGVLALLVIGPNRAIGVVDVEVGAIVALTTAAASASTVVLIRPYVDPMVAHVWAGIAGAGLALPFMIAGISPALVMAGAITLGFVDRVRGARFEREVAFRKQLEADYAAKHGDGGRGIGVSGLPGMPPMPRAPRPRRPWSVSERRATLWLGIAAVLIVAVAWTAGSAAAEIGLLQPGQGFALASVGAVALIVQVAVLARVGGELREALAVAGGMLTVATIATLTAPIPVVSVGAIGLQSLAVGIIAGLIVHRVTAARAGLVVMLGITASIVWWLVVAPSGGLVLAFVAVATTLIALRRKVRS